MAISENIFEYVRDNHGLFASWAVWPDPGVKPKSNMEDLSIFEPPKLKETLEALHNDYVLVALNISDPPPLNWSTGYDRKRRIKDGNETTQTGRDCLEAAPGRCAGWTRSVSNRCDTPCSDYRADVLSLAEAIRRHGDGSTQRVEAASEGERASPQSCFRSHA